MALQGMNIMYAHTGAEHVQAQVWTKLLGDNATQGLDDFFTGPAFLAWFRMGNMQVWQHRLSSVPSLVFKCGLPLHTLTRAHPLAASVFSSVPCPSLYITCACLCARACTAAWRAEVRRSNAAIVLGAAARLAAQDPAAATIPRDHRRAPRLCRVRGARANTDTAHPFFFSSILVLNRTINCQDRLGTDARTNQGSRPSVVAAESAAVRVSERVYQGGRALAGFAGVQRRRRAVG